MSAPARVIAYSEGGVLKSEIPLPDLTLLSSGAIASDGTLYFGFSGRLYAYSGQPQPSPTPSPTATPTPTGTPTPTPLPQARPVILIHGIGGSRLGVGTPSPLRQGWPGDVAKGPTGNPRNLQFTEAGQPRTDTISAQLAAVDLLDLPGIPLFPDDPDMNDLVRYLTRNGYTENQNLFVFLYDFRFSVQRSAASLSTFIRDVQNRTGAPKVDIVAHSMGGLVAKQYLTASAAALNVTTLIMLGTPHLGAPKSLKALRYGDDLNSRPLSACKVKRAVHNMPGVYNLLPGRRYLAVVGGYFVDDADINSDGVRGLLNGFRRMTDTLKLGIEHSTFCQLHPSDSGPLNRLSSPLLDQYMVAFHDDLDDWTRPAGINVFMVAGYNRNTLIRIREYDGRQGRRIVEYRCSPQGDETVPLASASTVNASAIYYADFSKTALNTTHSEMVGNPQIQRQVLGLLRQGAGRYGLFIRSNPPVIFVGSVGPCA